MGNCFSDPSKPAKHATGGQRLGSAPSLPPQQPAAETRPPRQTNTEPPRTLGGGPISQNDADARERALAAAEERAKSAKTKGVNSSNPKAGQLSAKLDADRKAATSPKVTDQRMMDKGDWN